MVFKHSCSHIVYIILHFHVLHFFIILIIFLITIFFKCDSQKIQFGRYLCLAFNSYINMLKFIALDIKVCTPSELSP